MLGFATVWVGFEQIYDVGSKPVDDVVLSSSITVIDGKETRALERGRFVSFPFLSLFS